MSDHCRISRADRDVFLKWLNDNPEFKKRRPTIDELIKETRRRGSKLKTLLEQDVQAAAEIYWRQRAQYLLRHINVVKIDIRTNEATTKPVCAYIPVRIERDGRIDEENYIPAQRVANNPSMRQTVLQRAHADFLSWMHRWERYEEFMQTFSPVLTAYQEIEAELEAVA